MFSFYPCDPPYVTDEVRQAPSFQLSKSKMEFELKKMQKELHKSVPFFSTRYKVGCCLGLGTWQMILYAATICHNLKNCRTKIHP